MTNSERKEGICRLNVDGNGCDYLRLLSDLETKLRNNTNPKEKIELALQGALMFYGADRAYVIEVDDELGIGVNTYECCAPGIAPEIDNLQFMPFEMFPRWLCSLKSDTPIIITDLERIKTEFLEEYRYLGKRSVNSLLAVPFQKIVQRMFPENMMKQLLMESSIRKQRILQVIRLSLHIITLIRMKQLSILQSVS